MKIATHQLSGLALDWAVATTMQLPGIQVSEPTPRRVIFVSGVDDVDYSPSTNWTQAGPIIDRENISLSAPFTTTEGKRYENWGARIGDIASQVGDTPLEAAMRCYVASKFGGGVEIPQDLLS